MVTNSDDPGLLVLVWSCGGVSSVMLGLGMTLFYHGLYKTQEYMFNLIRCFFRIHKINPRIFSFLDFSKIKPSFHSWSESHFVRTFVKWNQMPVHFSAPAALSDH